MMEDHTRTLEARQATPFAMVPRWIARSGGMISGNAVQLYAVLMTYANNDTRTAFPALVTLAEDTGCSVSTVKRALKELEAFGALAVERRRNKQTGNFYANRYALIFDAPAALTSTDAHKPLSDPQVTDDLRREVTDDLITRPTKELDSLDTPAPATPMRVNDPLPDSLPTPGVGRERAEQADPISPAWYRSNDRHHALEIVQQAASHRADGNTDGAIDVLHRLDDLLAHALHADADEINGLREHDGWIPPKKAVRRLDAAVWLNQYLGALRSHGLL